MNSTDYKKAQELSKQVASLSKRYTPPKPVVKPKVKDLSFVKDFTVSPYLKDTSEPAEKIANKLNTLKEALDVKVIKNLPEETTQTIAQKLNSGEGIIDAKVIRGILTQKDLEDIKVKAQNAENIAKSNTRPSKKIDNTDLRWHGGGDVVIAGTNITITTNSSGQKVISSTASSTVYTETPSGTVNDVNVTFTTLHTITTIYSFAINGAYIHPVDYSASGTTITFVSPLGTPLSGTPFTIVYS